MLRKTANYRRTSITRKVARSLRPLRAAIEAMESRVMLSTYVVNTFVDQIDSPSSTTVSLHDAIAKAAAHAGPDTIDVPTGDYKLTLGALSINDTAAVTIQGTGGLATITAQSKFNQVFNLDNALDNVTLNGLSITGASSIESSQYNGAVYNNGNLTIVNSVISGNAGVGLLNLYVPGDGVLGPHSLLTGVTVSKNKGGGIVSNGTVTIASSTIAGNQSNGVIDNGTASIVNSTIANNQGRGIYSSGDCTLSLFDSTVAGNLNLGVGFTQLMIGNTILAGNNAGGGDVGNSTIVSKGGNVIGDDAGQTTGWLSSDQLGSTAKPLNPMLAPLGKYGGPTQTMPPMEGSDALGKGVVSAIPTGVTTDQSGMARVVGGKVDSGAVEIQAPIGIVVNTTNDQTDPASSKTVSLRDAVNRADAAFGPVAITFDPTVFATPKTIHLMGDDEQYLTLGGNPFGTTTITGTTAGVTIDFGSSGGVMVQSDATVTFNDINFTGVAYAGGGITNAGNLNVTDSTISGVFEGVYNTGNLTLTGSTISGNYSGIDNAGQAVITGSTITDNIRPNFAGYDGGGIANETTGKVTLSNSIIAGNQASNNPGPAGDVSGVINSLGHNLIGEKDDSTGWLASDLTGTIAHPLNPKLSPLGSFGGPTQTQFPLAGSPALGAGSTSLIPVGVTTDQRGYKRIVNGKVDIGAFETQNSTLLSITAPAAQSAVAGTVKAVSLGSFSDPGASGPFTVSVAWGDGSPVSVFTEKTAESLGTLNHTFVALGTLTNTIYVLDSAGDLKTVTFTVASAPQALKTITVNTIKDVTDSATSTTVSLRDAIDRADASFGPVDITFSPTVFATAQIIALSSSAVPVLQDNIFGPIDFIGPAAGVTVKSDTLYKTVQGEMASITVPYNNMLTVNSGIAAGFSNFTFLKLGIQNNGSITLVDSTITGNTVVGNGAGIDNYGTAKILDSTISGNTAQINEGSDNAGGGYGGGIENQGTLSIVNSTISGNSGQAVGGGIYNGGTAAISDSTISGNSSGFGMGDGIYNETPYGSFQPKVTLANTIVAGNTDSSGGSDVGGAFKSSGHNLIGKTDGSAGWTSTDLKGTVAHPLNAKLSALGNNGGPTQTMIPLSTSPALGAGSVSLIPTGVTTDQRGLPRVVGGKVDIGAVEI